METLFSDLYCIASPKFRIRKGERKRRIEERDKSVFQRKSGWPVDVKHRCHIRLSGFTRLGDVMTSGMGR